MPLLLHYWLALLTILGRFIQVYRERERERGLEISPSTNPHSFALSAIRYIYIPISLYYTGEKLVYIYIYITYAVLCFMLAFPALDSRMRSMQTSELEGSHKCIKICIHII